MADKRDYKKEYRDLYQPGKRPSLVDVPPIPMFLVDGAGDPSGAAYQAAMSALYTVTFTLKMSRLGPWQPEGYFDYVLPPLEGFWWTEEGGARSPLRAQIHLAVDLGPAGPGIRHAPGASLGAGGVRTEKARCGPVRSTAGDGDGGAVRPVPARGAL